MSRNIEHDGRGSLRLRFPFDRKLVELVKTVPGRRWNQAEKYWSVPEDMVVQLVDLLHPKGFVCDETTAKLYVALGGSRTLGGAPVRRKKSALPGLFDNPADEETDETERNPATGSDDYTVSRLNLEAAAALRAAFSGPVWLVGEISGFNKNAHRRHVGFHLVERDESGGVAAEINAILFDGVRDVITKRLALAGDPFKLEDEIKVRFQVHAEIYEAWGQYRARIEDLDIEYTLGEAARRREEIIRKLTEEGIIELNNSLPFPAVPLRVGLITSLNSDAYNDVLRTMQESGYAFDITVHGARVQGRNTEPSVLNALDCFRDMKDELDVILICRGGGSRTDLAWFDSEAIGRAVARFPLPVVVGIGHEQDRSVLDSAARSAKTPTAAAAMLVKSVKEFLEEIESTGSEILHLSETSIKEASTEVTDCATRLAGAATRALENASNELRHNRTRTALGARALLARRAGELDHSSRQLAQGALRDVAAARKNMERLASVLGPRSGRRLALAAERLEARNRRLELLDPRRVIERGYAVLRERGGKVVTDADKVPAGTALGAELRHGRLKLRSEGPELEEE